MPGGPGSGDDRGQLILVTGVVVATVLVALVLLVNAAIFTENLATRSTDSGAREALAYRGAVVESVGGIVDRENAAGYDDRASLEANVTAGVGTADDLLRRSSLEVGAVTSVNVSSMRQVDGALVRQTNGSRAFLNESDVADWRVASNLNRTRGFVATVDATSLPQTTAGSAGSAFHVVLDDSTNEWHAYVYENGAGDVAVAVKNASETEATEVCSVSNATATVDFTAGTLEGEECPGLDWAEGLSNRYDVEFANGDEAAGTYALTVRTEDGGSLAAASLVDGGGVADPGSPHWVPATYAVEVAITHESPSLSYGSTVRVAPGEPRA